MIISLSQAIEPVGDTTESVTHDQCDAMQTYG